MVLKVVDHCFVIILIAASPKAEQNRCSLSGALTMVRAMEALPEAVKPEETFIYLTDQIVRCLTLSRAGFFGAPVGRGGGGGGAQSTPLVKTLFPFSESTQVNFF